MSDTGEIKRTSDGGFGKYRDALVVALTIAAVTGGVGAYVRSEVTAAQLKLHTEESDRRFAEVKADIRAMRTEIMTELREMRGTERRR